MNHLTGEDVALLMCNIGGKNFVFIILYSGGQAKVKELGDGVFVVRDEMLQNILQCEDIKFVSEKSATVYRDGVMTVSIAITGKSSTLGDSGRNHYALILADAHEDIRIEVEKYIEAFDYEIEHVHEDYSLLSEPDFMKFKRIDDTGNVGVAAMKHPKNPNLIVLGIFLADRTLADLDEHGVAVIPIDEMSHFFGNEFRQVIVAKNLRYAQQMKHENKNSLVLALPKQVAQLNHFDRHFADIEGRTFCLIRVPHTDDIVKMTGEIGKPKFNPELN